MSKRTVDLNQTLPAAETAEQAALRRRLGRHLWARLHEYEGEGLTLSGPGFADQEGAVTVDFTDKDNAALVQRMAERYRIQAALLPDGLVRFTVGPSVSFEDVDYVQSVIGVLVG